MRSPRVRGANGMASASFSSLVFLPFFTALAFGALAGASASASASTLILWSSSFLTPDANLSRLVTDAGSAGFLALDGVDLVGCFLGTGSSSDSESAEEDSSLRLIVDLCRFDLLIGELSAVPLLRFLLWPPVFPETACMGEATSVASSSSCETHITLRSRWQWLAY